MLLLKTTKKKDDKRFYAHFLVVHRHHEGCHVYPDDQEPEKPTVCHERGEEQCRHVCHRPACFLKDGNRDLDTRPHRDNDNKEDDCEDGCDDGHGQVEVSVPHFDVRRFTTRISLAIDVVGGAFPGGRAINCVVSVIVSKDPLVRYE